MKLKWLAIFVSALAVMVLVIGCSNDEKSNGSVSGTEEGKITLNFHHWYNEDAGNWTKVIDAYEKENPGVKINSQPLVENLNHDEYLKKLDLLASSGEQLDILMFSNQADFAKRVDAGLIAPIDSYVEEEGLNLDEEYRSLPGKINGSYYALPGKSVTSLVLLNKDHLDAAGLPVPTDWTWDDYEEYAKKLTITEGVNKRYGTYFHTWPDTYLILKLMNKEKNTNIINEDDTSNMDDPMVKESLELRYRMEQVEQTAVPYAETLSQKLNYRQQFFTQAASMIPSGSWMVSEWGEFIPDFKIAWAPLPKNNKEDQPWTIIQGDVVSVAQNSEHKEEAYKFIRWFTTEGIMLQQKSLPSWIGADLNEVIDHLLANTAKPEAVDKESLIFTLENAVSAERGIPQSYISEAYDEYNAEAELYLLGEQDIETTMKNAKEKIQAIIDSNK
ncbi:ABC transporter substrate-binding protein [Metabacillus sp. HB246100]|uniref:ABC transporter substrate-binding protein n=1 Tax=Bacillus weihaiensis TaxID=1547283 RepID=UPI00235799DD|nr:sugar ABC transporter substrate-binding protein [Bacillus weihaiensis]